jgi:hypothetical protein
MDEKKTKKRKKEQRQKQLFSHLQLNFGSYEGGRSLLAKHCWDQLGHNFV